MSWQAKLPTLVPRRFTQSTRFLQYLQSIGQWIDVNPQAAFDGLLNLVDVDSCPTAYLQYLADSIGLTLNQSLGSDDQQLRQQIKRAVDWYKIKGTYEAVKVILYTVQLSATVYDLYTLDYKNFVRMYWFSLGADDPTQHQVYPNTWVNGMYKTPHFDVVIGLVNYFGTYPNWYLIQGNQFTVAQQLIEQVRPANTVPHYYANVTATGSDNFQATTIASSQVSTIVIENNWQALTYTLDNVPLKYMDQGNIFDFSLTSFLQSWNTFVIGTGAQGNKLSNADQFSVLLLPLNNSVEDWSFNNFSVTNNNVTFVQTPSYFTGQKSAYFNGSSSYLQVTNQNEFTFTGDFTVEALVNMSVGGGLYHLIGNTNTSATIIGWQMYISNDNKLNFGVSTTASGSWDYLVNSGSTILTTNTWYHVAAVKHGSVLTLYVNGISCGTVSIPVSISTSSPLMIGADLGGSQYFNGYMQQVNVDNGLAKWTSNFTQPLPSQPYSALNIINPIFTGTVKSIVIGSSSVTFTCQVPNSFAQNNINELGIYSNLGTVLQVVVNNPAINKVNGYVLEYDITINF